MKKLSRGAAFLAVTCVPLTAVAAPVSPGAGQTASPVSSADPKEPGFAAEKDRADEVHAQLDLPTQHGLVVRNIARGLGDTKTVRYDRTYKGLSVLGGDVVVTRSASGEVVEKKFNASGKIAVDSTDPGLSRKQALTKGEGVATKQGIAEGESKDHAAELVVFAQGEEPVLAYDVLTTGMREDQTPSRLHTIVDASSGEVLASWDEIKNGVGDSMYLGSVEFETTASGGTYEMRDSHGNHTTDMNHSQYGSGELFTDSDDQWGDGTASGDQTAGVDAQYGAQMTYDYFERTHDRAGIWDNGDGARSRVHYGNEYVNAFWDGTQMTYGDGRNNQHPLTSLDVAAHEMTHGVTEATAGLVYYGDAGGLNEATSDIFAAAMEFHTDNSTDVGDYMVGEQIDINGDGTPLRYMDQPSKDGRSYDCYSGAVSGADPHYSSGPLNHWFFLASEGSGSSTVNGVEYNSPTCDGSAVEPVGRTVAAAVWYRTLDTKLTSGSTYTDARDGAIESAMELYGDGSTECHGIQAAFDAITVPAGAVECAPRDGGGDPDPGPTPEPSEAVTNGSFEDGASGWSGDTGTINDLGIVAHSGQFKAYLVGYGSMMQEGVRQQVTVPDGGELAFHLRVDTDEPTYWAARDTMEVNVVDASGNPVEILATYSNLDASDSYAQQRLDMSGYAGQDVTIQFIGQEDTRYQTSFLVDDVTLQ